MEANPQSLPVCDCVNVRLVSRPICACCRDMLSGSGEDQDMETDAPSVVISLYCRGFCCYCVLVFFCFQYLAYSEKKIVENLYKRDSTVRQQQVR